MLRKLKLRLTAIALAAIVLTCCTQGTLAFYSTIGTATNVVTSGDIQLIIHETTDQGTPFPEDGVYILPGDVVSKQVSVENLCAHPFYLRVKLVYGADSETLSAQDCLKLNIDETNWKWKDGWYYYVGEVKPGETTPCVFTKVEVVGAKVGTDDIGKTLSLTVVAQAVQSENNPITGGDTSTASGWPME